MPETRLERVVAALGLVVIAVLVAVIVREWPGSSPVAATRAAAPRPVPAAVTTTEPPPVAPRTTTTVAATAPAPTPRTATLSLTAARADSWFEVRAGSPTGTVLYSGILPRGNTRTFRAAPLWLRFGAAANLDVRVDGRAVHIPGGTYSARFAHGAIARQ